MRIEVIRHGETDWQRDGRYQGKTDVPLADDAPQQLQASDRPVARVYVSPLIRARQTADILFPEAQQVVVEGLQEMDFGVFEGCYATEMAEDPAYRMWVDGGCVDTCPEGEDLARFSDRVCAAFENLLDKVLAEGVDDELIIVAHGGTIMAVMERFALPHADYFDWLIPCGQGFVLDSEPWETERHLRLIGQADHTRASADTAEQSDSAASASDGQV